MNKTIEERQAKQKGKFLKQLTEVPIVSIVCKRIGISRSTFYRWKNEDSDFAMNINQEMEKGVSLINDMAEANLLTKIKEKDMTALIFWLKHRHPAFAQKLNITAKMSGLSPKEIEDLTSLLYGEKTFREGQERLTSYVLQGRITDKAARTILKAFISQLRADDVFSRKAEVEMMSKVLNKGAKKHV